MRRRLTVASRTDNKVRGVPSSSRGISKRNDGRSEAGATSGDRSEQVPVVTVSNTIVQGLGCIEVSEIGDHGQNITRKASLEVGDRVSDVVAYDKVLVTPTSLMSGKHTRNRVIEEGLKRVLKDNNGKSTYGPIRKARTKGATRNTTSAAGVT
ncbi:hypothetical protein V6N11_018767 [Hibiscus sabdariffa]|uniref:Uncharacterized protein n=2 Tax=Hibiscus sabdariffa TaxID=183260 RepID=A0ABR2AUL8_9ROSI